MAGHFLHAQAEIAVALCHPGADQTAEHDCNGNQNQIEYDEARRTNRSYGDCDNQRCGNLRDVVNQHPSEHFNVFHVAQNFCLQHAHFVAGVVVNRKMLEARAKRSPQIAFDLAVHTAEHACVDDMSRNVLQHNKHPENQKTENIPDFPLRSSGNEIDDIRSNDRQNVNRA